MLGVRTGGYYDPAGARANAFSLSTVYLYLLRVFIIPATGIFIVTTLKRALSFVANPVMDSDTLEWPVPQNRSHVLLRT